MAKSKVTDVFANQAYATVTESAANTLTFSEIQTGISLFEKVAWVIHQIMWFNSSRALLLDGSDYQWGALVVSNKISSITLQDPAVLDMVQWGMDVFGTAANKVPWTQPFVRDFTALPGGGLIVPPKPLYIACESASLASASTLSMRIYFSHRELVADEYWELVEARRMVE